MSRFIPLFALMVLVTMAFAGSMAAGISIYASASPEPSMEPIYVSPCYPQRGADVDRAVLRDSIEMPSAESDLALTSLGSALPAQIDRLSQQGWHCDRTETSACCNPRCRKHGNMHFPPPQQRGRQPNSMP